MRAVPILKIHLLSCLFWRRFFRDRTMFRFLYRSSAQSFNSLNFQRGTEIQRQNDCSCCWAITTADSSTMFMHHHNLIMARVRLAPNILLDCCCPEERLNTNCHYYEVDKAFDYVMLHGLPNMEGTPFTTFKCVCGTRSTSGRRYRIPNWRSLSIEESEMKTAIESFRFIVISINIDRSFDNHLHTQEIWNGPVAPERDSSMHSVVAYGWDIDPATGQYFWLIKNSNGLRWGDQGYGKILFRSCMPVGSRPYIYYAYCPCF